MRIGIDLGGTKTEGIALGDQGNVLVRRRLATPRRDYRATVATVAKMIADIERTLGAKGSVGVGTPGAIAPASGRMDNCNSTWLNGMPLREDLEVALDRPVRIANDANCLVLSEATDGAGAEHDVVFGVILGTGVGGGISIGGRLIEGINAIAGEWGHNPLPGPGAGETPGPLCYCGRNGCVETWLSGPGMASDHLRANGERLQAAAIAERAARGERSALATLERYCDRLARSLASVINVLDPDVIVVAGGVSNVEALYRRVPELWGHHIFAQRVDTRLVRALHGDSSGVRGAAWLWPA
jgi:predicted NBD/HSP70 family sugar kinase